MISAVSKIPIYENKNSWPALQSTMSFWVIQQIMFLNNNPLLLSKQNSLQSMGVVYVCHYYLRFGIWFQIHLMHYENQSQEYIYVF